MKGPPEPPPLPQHVHPKKRELECPLFLGVRHKRNFVGFCNDENEDLRDTGQAKWVLDAPAGDRRLSSPEDSADNVRAMAAWRLPWTFMFAQNRLLVLCARVAGFPALRTPGRRPSAAFRSAEDGCPILCTAKGGRSHSRMLSVHLRYLHGWHPHGRHLHG